MAADSTLQQSETLASPITSNAPASRGELALVLAIALLQALLMLNTAWDKADTADEPTYLGSAALQFVHHDFSTIRHAPVPKWGFGLALWLVDPRLGELRPNVYALGRRTEGTWKAAAAHVLWSRPLAQMRLNLFAARASTIVITVLGGLLLWRAGRRLGVACGLLCQAVWAASPTVLAHGSLVTLDAWSATFLAGLLLALIRLAERPGFTRVAAVGLTLGLALGCKAHALVALPVVVAALAVIARRSAGPAWPATWARWLAVLSLGGVLTLWAANCFSVGEVNTWHLTDMYGWPRRRIGPLPFPRWIEGLFFQLGLAKLGRRSYLFGRVSTAGWAWFYPVCVALKTTVAAQVLALLAGGALLALRSRRALLVDAGLLAFPLLLLAALTLGRNQAGIRYLLPAFPCLILWAVRGALSACERLPPRAAACALGLVVAGGAWESLRLHPHHLMFYSLWVGGPARGPQYLIVCDDWGQDQRRVAEFQRERRLSRIFYLPYTGRPRRWGIRFDVPSCEPAEGTYALQAVEVHRPRALDPGCLDWLTIEPPDLRLGWSVYVYEVDAQRLARLRSGRGRLTPFYSSAAAYGSSEGGQPQLEDELDSFSDPETSTEPDTTESDEPPPAR